MSNPKLGIIATVQPFSGRGPFLGQGGLPGAFPVPPPGTLPPPPRPPGLQNLADRTVTVISPHYAVAAVGTEPACPLKPKPPYLPREY